MPRSHPMSPPARHAAVTAAALTVAVLASGCGAAAGSSSGKDGGHKAVNHSAKINDNVCGKGSRTIKHDLGSTTVKGHPKRIVTLEYSFTDALVNSGIKPVGIADDDKPERILKPLRDAVGHYTSVGLRQSPNLQVIKSLKPDLIIADSQRHSALYQQLTKIAPTVAFASRDADYQQILDTEKLIGQAVDECSRMSAALKKHAEFMAGLKAKVTAGDKRRILFAITFDKGVNGQTQHGFAPSVLHHLGLSTEPTTKGRDAALGMTLETMVTTKPDVMFLAPQTPNVLTDQWKSSTLWKRIPAVEHNAVHTVDSDVWSTSRGTLAAEMIAGEAVKKLFGTS
ncbi:Fe(3+) dicitrate ABC transporter substrate-binding protein [Streptomyces sparsogenes]|uniref:ABC transporter substrate-binding protein n=1 Tax=Streptomyces sparsogenes TaxID=67365 RepID=UPI0033D8BCC9